MTIVANSDMNHIQAIAHILNPDGPFNEDDALIGLLENESREIDSLTELLVLAGEEEWPVDIAEETEDWFSDRTRQRAFEAAELVRQKSKDSETKKDDIKCDFCGYENIWAEYYNLCNFCGRYGHLRRACTALRARGSK